MATLVLSRRQTLAYRQHATHLHRRLPHRRMVEAAYAGLQDSSPRSAVLALHARVSDVSASDWEDSQFVQIWGPRGADYVVPENDLAVFTIGRMPRDPSGQNEIKAAMQRVGNILRQGDAKVGQTPTTQSRQYLHDLRIASITGSLLIRWDGSRITWWAVDPPAREPEHARLELARRFLQSLGPSTPAGFAWWSGGTLSDAKQTFRSLDGELSEVKLPTGKSWALKECMSSLELASSTSTIRLLPQGDSYLCAADRELLVPDPRFRAELWPRSVWPGGLLIQGELSGTWRRQQGRVTVHPWRRISSHDMEDVEREVKTLPIESTKKEVRWERPLRS